MNSSRHLSLLMILACSLPTAGLQAQEDDGRNAETRLRWHREHMRMRVDSPFKELEWRFIGPEIMSGRVTDIAVPPDQPYTFYVATASGGIWKTVNEGTTWEPIFDDAPSTSVGDLAVDPNNPQRVWAGLGEANIFRSSMAGTGIYRSDNGGKSWRHMGLAATHTIARILVHPQNSDVVYVAAGGHEWTDNEERGVYKTVDGGSSWQKVLYESPRAGAYDLVMDPQDPETLYASLWHRIRLKWSDPKPGPGGGIYKSTDGGDSWRRVSEGLPQRDKAGRTGLDIARSNPNILYALIDNHESARQAEEGERDSYGRSRSEVIKGAEVYKSEDKGETWAKVSESGRTMQRLFSTYGWVFGQIRVDPNDADRVYIMGVPMLTSTDGGKTFSGVRYRGLHGDHHALWIDPNNSNYLINGNDGGVNISYDQGETWKDFGNLGVVQFYNLTYDMAEPFNVYGSIQDNGSWMGPVSHRPGRDAPTQWKSIPGGEASYHAFDWNDYNTLYSEGFYGRIQRSSMNPRETTRINVPQVEGEDELRGQWLAPFIVSKHNSQVIYHGMQSVYRSMNRGDDWTRISPDLSYNDPEKLGDIPHQVISSLSESPLKFGLVYAGTDDGRVHVTKNSGDEWTEIIAGLPEKKWVSRLVASAYDEATVYLAQNGKRDDDFTAYLFRSKDFGSTWEDISAGIPSGPINVIKEDPKNGDILYVGTDLGVYVTTDGAKTWNVLGSGLPITFVHDLIVHPRDNIMVIATHGRGMYALDVKSVQEK